MGHASFTFVCDIWNFLFTAQRDDWNFLHATTALFSAEPYEGRRKFLLNFLFLNLQ